MRGAVLGLVLAALAAGRAHAQAADPPAVTGEARAHWERGLAEHAARHYQAASAEFAACYRLAQRRECLFAWAQATRLAGDCDAARELYRRYLQGDLSPRQAEAARSQLAACEAQIAARAGGGADPTGEPRTTEPAASPAQPPPIDARPPPGSPWYRDRWGDVLGAGGVAAVAVGAALYASARRDAGADAPTYDAYAEQFRGAEATRRWALAAIGAGSALIATAVIHMALHGGAAATAPAASPAPRIDLVLDRTQLALRCAGAF